MMLQSKQQEAAVLAEVGDGGFSMQDIELIQQLGRLSWVRTLVARRMVHFRYMGNVSAVLCHRSLCSLQVTECAREDPLQVSRNTLQQQTAVIAFKAQYYSGLPFQVR